jgi:hypothetical protein
VYRTGALRGRRTGAAAGGPGLCTLAAGGGAIETAPVKRDRAMTTQTLALKNRDFFIVGRF